ncbi:hypothetical protein PSACC_01681 [Paramicrosporidium saccamoebae]|uniref:Phosphoglucomutase n=1 Tax=Paramicrosporidium saccamoebae TaxID=1246581 RepID=A0A2H9TL98_9FUNG|nr:hypothetical protein PSACC_01681 [Paramicrosporidium saccamoebae]
MRRLEEASERGDETARAVLNLRLERDISFGTAGLRATMNPGFSCMNGLATYVKQKGGHKVVVGYDHRHNSLQFFQVTVATLKKAGLSVLGFSESVATPMVPFSVQNEGAACGIMITASHNPANDNGYKVYASNACQNYSLWDIDPAGDFEDIYARALGHFVQSIGNLLSPLKDSIHITHVPSIVYTPIHGVGMKFAKAAIEALNLPPLLEVPSQKDPDPNFSTVKFPNPEEGPETLDEAFQFATATNSKLIFANDPDADRFSCCEFVNEWKIFNGNEIAALFAHYVWQNRSIIAPDATEFAMLGSVVSSHLISTMGTKEGFLTQETLTGFKYLANASQKLETERPGLKVLLAFEEAIGFMINSAVWDKDGISAMCLMYLMVLDVYSHNKTLTATLAEIYDIYGYFSQYNSYYFCDPVRVSSIFAALRTKLHERVPGSTENLTGACQISLDSEHSIMSINDYPGSNMVTLCFGHGWVTLRASGTEPKIKFYSEMHSKSAEKVETDEKLKELVNNLCRWLLDPEMNKLILQGE